MDSFHLRRILLHLGLGTKCPNCGAKINISKVKITAHDKENCLVKVTCEECKKSFGGHARMVAKLTDDGKKLNTSTLIQKAPPVPQQVTTDDVVAVHDFFEIHSGEFKEELQKPSPFLFLSEL